jgi:hypothetical protein
MQRDREALRRRRQLLVQLAAGCAVALLFAVRESGALLVISLVLVLVVAVALLFASGALTWLGVKGLRGKRRG